MRVEYKLRKYKITFFKFWSRIEIAPQDDGVGSRLLEYLVHQLVNLLDAVVLVVVAVAVRRGGHRVVMYTSRVTSVRFSMLASLIRPTPFEARHSPSMNI